jgi:hypothetical protein
VARKPEKVVRCAIYTRKSTEHGLALEFNSLDAQREACEAYIKSQASAGWHALSNRYDDPAYSGGSMDRPALQKLLKDIEAAQIDVVVVYKIDRLTRSLADFAKLACSVPVRFDVDDFGHAKSEKIRNFGRVSASSGDLPVRIAVVVCPCARSRYRRLAQRYYRCRSVLCSLCFIWGMARMDQLYPWSVDFSVAMDPGVSTYRRAEYQFNRWGSNCVSGNSGVVANPLRFTV